MYLWEQTGSICLTLWCVIKKRTGKLEQKLDRLNLLYKLGKSSKKKSTQKSYILLLIFKINIYMLL